MTSSAEDITSYFEAYGWDFERREDAVFRTGFVGETGHYDIWLRITEAWVYFTINPYVDRREGKRHGSGTLTELLKANHELNLAKFGVDEDGDVLLAVELPTDGFCYAHFADALTALSHYADDYRPRFNQAMDADHAEVV
jgi:hypothetical protein